MNDRKEYDILICDTACLKEDFSVAYHQDIVLDDGKIADVFPAGTKEVYGKETIVGKGRFWMPGLVDGHMHTGQQLLKGAVLDELPMIWTRIMLPFESTLTPEKMELSAGLAALEMIRSGTTGFVDAGSYYMEQAAQVYETSGLRGALSCSAMDQGQFPESVRQSTREVLESEDQLYDRFHGQGNLKVYYALRALMNCSQELIEQSADRARERNTFLQAHMNEYPGEVNYTLERYKMRPVEYVRELGALNENFVAAHGIMLSAREKTLLGERNAKVVHCPFSNCAKGVPDTSELLEKKICVALGTDGAAHGGLSLWNEMKIFRSVMNAVWGSRTADPQIMSAKQILSMVCEGGAAVLGEEGRLGVIRPGYKADLIGIDIEKPHLFPTANLVNTLLECVTAGDVTDSIVGGKVLMRNREVRSLDEEKIMYEAKKYFETGKVGAS